MFKVLGFLLKFYPTIVIVISVVEGLMSDRPGDEKKAVVLRAISEIASKFGIVLNDSIMTLISQSIDAIVTALNVMKVFGHKDDTKDSAPILTASGRVVEPVQVVESAVDVQLRELEELLLK